MDEKKYIIIWRRYLPVIRLFLKKSALEEQKFNLNKTDFEFIGDRKDGGYTFSLVMNNGKVTNTIQGIARDLYEILQSDSTIKEMLKNKIVKMNVGKSCIFTIKTTPISTFKEAVEE